MQQSFQYGMIPHIGNKAFLHFVDTTIKINGSQYDHETRMYNCCFSTFI